MQHFTSRRIRVSLSLLSFQLAAMASLHADEVSIVASSPLAVVSQEFGLCDGPAWDGRGGLYVPDVREGRLMLFRPQSDQWTTLVEGTQFSASFFNHGRLFLCDNRGCRIVRLEGRQLDTLDQQPTDATPACRPNDLVVDHYGGIYYTLTATNQVIYVSPESESSVAIEQIAAPNGLILSPDESTLYVSAYRDKQIWAYDVGVDGMISNARLFTVMDDGDEPGADGMTVDRAGNVYCAGAHDIWIWSPSGVFLDKITPPTRPINCAFGDADMRTLYITCMDGLYRQRMNISGRAPHPSRLAEHQLSSTTVPPTTLPDGIDATLDVVYAEYGDRRMLADIFRPSDDNVHPGIILVHGGGWLNGDKTKFRALAIELARRGYAVMAIEYRLAGEAHFPAAIHDCNASIRYLRSHAETWRVDADRIAAVGGSAGGHLVALMATGSDNPDLQGEGGNPGVSTRLQAAVIMAGPLEMTTGSVAERSRTQGDRSNSNQWMGATIDEAFEMYALADAHLQITSDDPPMLFQRGDQDQPHVNDPSIEKLQSLGITAELIIYPDAQHGCWNQLPWLHDFSEDIDRFLLQQLQ